MVFSRHGGLRENVISVSALLKYFQHGGFQIRINVVVFNKVEFIIFRFVVELPSSECGGHGILWNVINF